MHIDEQVLVALTQDQEPKRIAADLWGHADVFGQWMMAIQIGDKRATTVERLDWLIYKLELMLVVLRILKTKLTEGQGQ